jgi:hypothetical protein
MSKNMDSARGAAEKPANSSERLADSPFMERLEVLEDTA